MPRRPSIASCVLAAAGIAAGAAGWATSVGAGGEGLRRTPVVEAVRRAAPAVVVVQTEAPGRSQNSTIRGSGSGVIVHPDGYVVTNSHVIRGAQKILVETSKSSGHPSRRLEAALVEDDPSRDLALLRVARGAGLPYVGLCSTAEVMVGESAIAIGNPYGLGPSVTMGVISAKGRRAAVPNGTVLRDLLQTDASINFGNSGGALLDLEGDLLGINCSVHPQGQGIAFTIPSDQVRALLDRNLVASATKSPAPPVAAPVPAPTLSGAPPAHDSAPAPRAGPDAKAPAPTVAPSAPPAARARATPAPGPAPAAPRASVGLSLRQSGDGILVGTVDPLSPAEIAGLLPGDVIREIDGQPVGTVSETATLFRTANRGRAFLLTLRRADRTTRVVLVVPTV
jgi:S1-C subfamily serine protease